LELSREIVRKYEGLVFRTLARLTGRGEGIEDLAQEVFLRLYRALPHFQARANLSTYVYRIVVNVAKDELHRAERARRLISLDDPGGSWPDRLVHPALDPAQTFLHGQLMDALERAISQLGLHERAVLTLYYQEERSYGEIAEILGIPMGTVKTHLFRARQRLRSIMKEWVTTCQKARRNANP
jgi:RNA polymerase sigma-70 factor (ECF subfamily)